VLYTKKRKLICYLTDNQEQKRRKKKEPCWTVVE